MRLRTEPPSEIVQILTRQFGENVDIIVAPRQSARRTLGERRHTGQNLVTGRTCQMVVGE